MPLYGQPQDRKSISKGLRSAGLVLASGIFAAGLTYGALMGVIMIMFWDNGTRLWVLFCWLVTTYLVHYRLEALAEGSSQYRLGRRNR